LLHCSCEFYILFKADRHVELLISIDFEVIARSVRIVI
jgi:hypothetical protein